MKLIRIEETGLQIQYNLPDLTYDGLEANDSSKEPVTEEEIRKKERINKMLLAQGKTPENQKVELFNYIEPNFIYATSSGYEYIKLTLDEFWAFINTLNALASIDLDESGFYSLNFYVSNQVNFGNKTTSKDLVQFEYYSSDKVNWCSNNALSICDALAAGIINEQNYKNFFNDIKLLG